MKTVSLVLVCFACGRAAHGAEDTAKDVVLRAMSDEMKRTVTLQLSGLEKPYFVRYAMSDGNEVSITASMGGLVRSFRGKSRQPTAEIRVGSYAFDNTNSVYATRLNIGLAPLDDDYYALRDTFWLASDALYKVAAMRITSKRNALRDVATPDTTPDFAPAKPFKIVQETAKLHVNATEWESEARRLSARFANHPDLMGSNVRLFTVASTYRVTTSEGSEVRVPQGFTGFEVEANGLGPDGRVVRDSYLYAAHDASEMPSEDKLTQAVDAVATDADALRKAPVAEAYSGPVLFEQKAAAQLMAELMADGARLTRKPVAPPGAETHTLLDSAWATRIGSSVTPAWLSIEDDPLKESFAGVHLAGHYEVDDEAVPAQRVSIVEKGVLKGFLMSREPVRNWNGSNGHGRLPGPYETEEAVIGTLFVHSDQAVPEAQMKQKLIERVKAAGLPYGLTVRKLDFPSTSSAEELQDIGKQAEKGGYARTITPPLLAYRVYPDGREELVRSVRFTEFSAKDLRDLAAASDRPYVLNYLNKGSAFDLADVGGSAALSSVVCPSLLMESVSTERAEDDVKKPPVVPPPALRSQR